MFFPPTTNTSTHVKIPHGTLTLTLTRGSDQPTVEILLDERCYLELAHAMVVGPQEARALAMERWIFPALSALFHRARP